LRAEHLAAGERPQVESNVRSVVFDASRGTSTPTGTFRVVGRDARAVHLVVNIMGRVRACTPTPGLSGYPAC
jgi:type IV fimbrial biogenesis protein FimT